MENGQRELTQKLMDAFSRFRRLHRGSPLPGIKHSELRILFRLKKIMTTNERGARISELSKVMRVTSPTVTQLVNGLEERGLVERNVDPNDRRSILVTLTQEGEAVIQEAADAFFAEFSSLVLYLGEEKTMQLIELLTESFDFLRNNSHAKIVGDMGSKE
ncbi:MAG: MarR family transcriptional regulator [Firmicutes bacterium]|nr:MarR family transcriptional regulator [Bacillota bacterium]